MGLVEAADRVLQTLAHVEWEPVAERTRSLAAAQEAVAAFYGAVDPLTYPVASPYLQAVAEDCMKLLSQARAGRGEAIDAVRALMKPVRDALKHTRSASGSRPLVDLATTAPRWCAST